MARVLRGDQINRSATYPGLGRAFDESENTGIAVGFPRKSVERLFEKIVRGLTFIENERFITAEHLIRIHPPNGGDPSPLTEALEMYGEVHACGPGIVVRKALASDDGVSAIYEITIWGVFSTYASVTQAET